VSGADDFVTFVNMNFASWVDVVPGAVVPAGSVALAGC
jgi:hypothetical protein